MPAPISPSSVDPTVAAGAAPGTPIMYPVTAGKDIAVPAEPLATIPAIPSPANVSAIPAASASGNNPNGYFPYFSTQSPVQTFVAPSMPVYSVTSPLYTSP
jgi:hypothetical protein